MDKNLIIAVFASFITVLLVTPFVMKLAVKIGATDKPNSRKVHTKLMPRLGGLAIFIGVAVGYFISGLYNEHIYSITLGGVLIIALGILDDKYELSARIKLAGQIIVAFLIAQSGLTIDFLYIPFVDKIDVGFLSIPLTIIWIVGITNAINLIDGLDGLAAGISSICIGTIAFMAAMNGNILIFTIAMVVLASTLGFLFYNFHPAKIFMGDAGSLFLGYIISILSLLGLYKSVTLFSFVVPIIILGVPVFDTSFAIIRRIVNKKPISAPDKSHLHHRIMALGISHRATVLYIYALGIIFSASALIFSKATLWGSIFIIVGLLLVTSLIAETIGLVNERYKPFLKAYKKFGGRNN
ncbi:undecaprenyl/decaprenyl-phosphate alpha-N-acetylglucosaminyl 1-phosphate transferase [Peribacillus cavernae]|uniref:Undecaprenyl/decaprenyl-phosphate alpha-N-acetylglucosaminyl 1-phosphate transferase n=1 Tax=Peribacillus cavernae TaxID=1674310 RepID=A0A3S0U0D3_9BACI|nr:MraY family glycosyltransferase [Peribacillus cavernae]MDQ0218443.1 UDP-GlcNAc:undecaprenyl-phosphate GlcNAc-1-phosphate transferase [Peribacillus cavernae]RUQ31444.1 undecaprenyl/decaprenyl-phosphate alpha-N-acetylglucosaminyl 1-phosphate transferase [Peribacillus cavernae]